LKNLGAIINHQSTIINQQSATNNQKSKIKNCRYPGVSLPLIAKACLSICAWLLWLRGLPRWKGYDPMIRIIS